MHEEHTFMNILTGADLVYLPQVVNKSQTLFAVINNLLDTRRNYSGGYLEKTNK